MNLSLCVYLDRNYRISNLEILRSQSPTTYSAEKEAEARTLNAETGMVTYNRDELGPRAQYSVEFSGLLSSSTLCFSPALLCYQLKPFLPLCAAVCAL